MLETIRTMNEEQLREVIAGIARSADSSSIEMMSLRIDLIDCIGDELMRRVHRIEYPARTC